GDEHVRPAVAVEVGTEHTESRAGESAQAGGDCDVLELHPALRRLLAGEVVEELADPAGKRPRCTVIALAAGVRAWPTRVVIDVVDDDQVEPAVAVVIEERRRRSPGAVAQARVRGDVAEGAVAVVQE